MTDIAVTSPLERIARVIAASKASANAEGLESSAGATVDDAWRDRIGEADSILRTLREATPAMVEAGRTAGSDPAAIWAAMVGVALESEPG